MNKNQELQELQNTITQIFIKNINYLSKKHPNIYNKIQEFEKLNIENFFLEFENNHFELKDKNGNKFYNTDPFFDAQKRALNIEDKLSFSLIKTKKIENHVHYENSINAYECINEYIDYAQRDKSYEKFIFLGVLLGVHINDLHKKLNSKVYLIFENSIEIFRLSMFLTDYEEIEKTSKLFFCIEENETSIRKIIKNFHSYKYEYNHFIHFEIINENYIKYIDILTHEFKDLDPFNYPFSEYLVSLKRAYNYINIENGILTFKNKFDSFDKPILFLGAGPSLAKEYEWVYMNQDKFIIVCAAACLKRLELLDIVPDIILSVDGQRKQVIHAFDVNEKYYKEAITIASIKTDEEVIKKISSENLFFMQDNLQVFDEAKIFTGLNVGDIGLKVLIELGAKNIYLLGYDSAIGKNGKTHDGIYKVSKVNPKEEIIKVKGNLQEEVESIFMYKQTINSFDEICLKKQNDVNIYNLSDGAFFENTIPKKTNDINLPNLKNKLEIINNFKEFLSNNVICDLTKKEITYIKNEQKILNKIKNNINNFNIEKYESSYQNSISIQVIKKFYKLLKPYSLKFDENILLKKQLKQLITKLDNLFTIS